MLRLKGLSVTVLHQIVCTTALTSTVYASPSWWGYANTQNTDKIETLICWMKGRGFSHKDDPSTCDTACKADLALFRGICTNSDHILYIGWPDVPDYPGQSRNGKKCPASRPGPFRDKETSRNEQIMLFCSFNKHKVTKYICNISKFICSGVQPRYVSCIVSLDYKLSLCC